MRFMSSTLLGLAGFAALGISAARADNIFDVEHARASARAGGPISELDAHYLELYGATSGTPGYDEPRRHYKKRYYHRSDRYDSRSHRRWAAD